MISTHNTSSASSILQLRDFQSQKYCLDSPQSIFLPWTGLQWFLVSATSCSREFHNLCCVRNCLLLLALNFSSTSFFWGSNCFVYLCLIGLIVFCQIAPQCPTTCRAQASVKILYQKCNIIFAVSTAPVFWGGRRSRSCVINVVIWL